MTADPAQTNPTLNDAPLLNPCTQLRTGSLPIVGHLPGYLRNKLGFLLDSVSGGERIVRLNLGGETFLLNDADDIRHVLETHARRYEKSSRLTDHRGRRLIGGGLLTSDMADAIELRRLLNPIFTRSSMTRFADDIVGAARNKLDAWRPDQEIDMAWESMSLARWIMGKSLFGLNFSAEAQNLEAAFIVRRAFVHHYFDSLFPFPEYLPTQLMRDYRRAIRLIDESIYRMIRERRSATSASEDMLSKLISIRRKDETSLTDSEVRDEALTLSLTSYETLGEAMAWTWYLLSNNSAIEMKLHLELDRVLGERPPTANDIESLTYTDMVFSESLRLYPPTWISVRIAREEDRLPGGARVSPGTKVYLCPWVVHRNPRYFPEPERFDPERFTPHAVGSRPKLAYFPFGGGPRVCLGQHFARIEGVLSLATIAQSLRFTLVPNQRIVPDPKITLRPKFGIRMRVESRSS